MDLRRFVKRTLTILSVVEMVRKILCMEFMMGTILTMKKSIKVLAFFLFFFFNLSLSAIVIVLVE